MIQVAPVVGGQSQCEGQAVEDCTTRSTFATLLQARVVVETHPGEGGKFLPAQTRSAAQPQPGGQADVGRPNGRPA